MYLVCHAFVGQSELSIVIILSVRKLFPPMQSSNPQKQAEVSSLKTTGKKKKMENRLRRNLLSYGNPSYGYHDLLGTGFLPQELSTVQLPEGLQPGEHFVEVAQGKLHFVARTNFGNLFASGVNTNGQVGVGQVQYVPNLRKVDFPHRRTTPIQKIDCGLDYSAALDGSGDLNLW